MNEKGVIPILVVGLIAIAFIVGAKVQQKVVEKTMICHDPNVHTFNWPSMSVPDYDRR